MAVTVTSRTRRAAWLRGAALLVLALVALGASPNDAEDEPTLKYFGAEGCPYCARQEVFLDGLEQRYPQLQVERYEVWADEAGRAVFIETLRERGMEPRGVPTTVLGERVWVGFDQRVGDDIERAVAALVTVEEPAEPDRPDPVIITDDAPALDLPLVGEVDLAGRGLVAATFLIGFVDGFNPCSLWVLTVLLAMVVNAGAGRGRIAAVGLTFLTVTALIYGAFIAGLFSVLAVAGVSTWIAVVVGVLAIAFGAINVKDYLWFKRGISLTIPDRSKPRIHRRGREIRRKDRPLPAVLGLTVAMAAGVALLELPCTAGFPVVWTGLLTAQGVGAAEFSGLLGMYLVTYLSVELAVFVVVLATLRTTALEEREGRALKLVGGVVMIALGGVLILAPELMESFTGSTAVVLGSIAAAGLLLVVHRVVLPRLGIQIGDQQPSRARRDDVGRAVAGRSGRRR